MSKKNRRGNQKIRKGRGNTCHNLLDKLSLLICPCQNATQLPGRLKKGVGKNGCSNSVISYCLTICVLLGLANDLIKSITSPTRLEALLRSKLN